MEEGFRLRRSCGFAKRRWPFQQKVEILFARLAKTLPLPEAQGSASLKHLYPHGQAGVLARHSRQHRRAKPASLKFRLHVKGVNMQMIRMRCSADAADAFPRDFNRQKRRRVESRTKPLAPKLRLEAAKAFEIRAQHADTQGQHGFEVRLRNGTQAEIRSHFIPAQNF